MRLLARHLPWLFACLILCPLAAAAAPEPAEKKERDTASASVEDGEEKKPRRGRPASR